MTASHRLVGQGGMLPRVLALVVVPAAFVVVVLGGWLANGGPSMTRDAGMGFGVITLFLIPPFVISLLAVPICYPLLRGVPLRRLLMFSGVVLLGYVVTTALLGLLIFAGLGPRDGGLADSLTFALLPFAPIVLALTLGYFVARRAPPEPSTTA